MATSCFAERLAKTVPLSDAEKAALARLEENPRKIKRGAMIQRVNETITELFVLREGRVMSYVILPDGSRQILRVYFPGDFIGSASTIYSKAPDHWSPCRTPSSARSTSMRCAGCWRNIRASPPCCSCCPMRSGWR